MLFERIVSEVLAHNSYLIGDSSEAVVIDPRRDCQVYIDRAVLGGYRIKYILETHRNEDYAIGSCELAERTGAEIWHADAQLDYSYGNPVEDGQTFRVGRLIVTAIHTPGHTPGSMSYLLHDQHRNPWAIFTGDALFAGDVGRVDLLGMDRADELAELLYDSIFDKILPLGDEVLVCPAHGAGSVCGSEISERVWTTIGMERKYNPKLQFETREEFISGVAKKLERPPYFRMMEKLNVEGAPILGSLPSPTPLKPRDFEGLAGNARVLDTRMELSFGSAHIPQAQSIWLSGLSSFIGWFFDYDKPLLLVSEGDDPTDTVRQLIRLGYDDIGGYLSGGMLAWHMSGKNSNSIETITVQKLCKYLDAEEDILILDVRSEEELENKGRIPDALNIHITQLPRNFDEIPEDKKIFIFCGSGLRSMIGASFLQREGWEDLVVILGGLSGWNSATCPVEL